MIGRVGGPAGRRLWLPFALLVVAVGLAACRTSEPVRLAPEILAEVPHDADAFTQGLLIHDGRVFESTGLYGRSSLREVVLATGEVLRLRPLADELFAEGLARVGDELIQLTWREGVALRYDLETFEPTGLHRYDGEGWGLCFDGTALWMSDGSARLTRRDPSTFEVKDRVAVTLDGEPLPRLNELECVDGAVWANVWQTDRIVRIDPERGRVEAVVDAAGLLDAETRASLDQDAVLNGIAWDGEAFWLTGKRWPAMFRVRFEEAGAARP